MYNVHVFIRRMEMVDKITGTYTPCTMYNYVLACCILNITIGNGRQAPYSNCDILSAIQSRVDALPDKECVM